MTSTIQPQQYEVGAEHLPIVAYEAQVPSESGDHTLTYPGNLGAVQSWLGASQEGVIEPLVRLKDALKEINSLSDMLVSVAETPAITIDTMHQFLNGLPPMVFELTEEGVVAPTETLGEAARTVVRRLNEEGTTKKEMYLNLAILPANIKQETVELVSGFMTSVASKLHDAEMKYGYEFDWMKPGWEDECRQHLMEHIQKGDPRDVAAYCAFLWFHGEKTV